MKGLNPDDSKTDRSGKGLHRSQTKTGNQAGGSIPGNHAGKVGQAEQRAGKLKCKHTAA